MSKVLFKTWFTSSSGCAGIIVTENEVGNRAAYAGPVSGFDEEQDIDFLKKWGGKVSINDLKIIIKLMGG